VRVLGKPRSPALSEIELDLGEVSRGSSVSQAMCLHQVLDSEIQTPHNAFPSQVHLAKTAVRVGVPESSSLLEISRSGRPVLRDALPVEVGKGKAAQCHGVASFRRTGEISNGFLIVLWEALLPIEVAPSEMAEGLRISGFRHLLPDSKLVAHRRNMPGRLRDLLGAVR